MNRLTQPETMQAWLSQGLTQEFLQYLKDRRQVLMEAWCRGVSVDQSEAEFLTQLIELDAGKLCDFYDVEVTNEQ